MRRAVGVVVALVAALLVLDPVSASSPPLYVSYMGEEGFNNQRGALEFALAIALCLRASADVPIERHVVLVVHAWHASKHTAERLDDPFDSVLSLEALRLEAGRHGVGVLEWRDSSAPTLPSSVAWLRTSAMCRYTCAYLVREALAALAPHADSVLVARQSWANVEVVLGAWLGSVVPRLDVGAVLARAIQPSAHVRAAALALTSHIGANASGAYAAAHVRLTDLHASALVRCDHRTHDFSTYRLACVGHVDGRTLTVVDVLRADLVSRDPLYVATDDARSPTIRALRQSLARRRDLLVLADVLERADARVRALVGALSPTALSMLEQVVCARAPSAYTACGESSWDHLVLRWRRYGDANDSEARDQYALHTTWLRAHVSAFRCSDRSAPESGALPLVCALCAVVACACAYRWRARILYGLGAVYACEAYRHDGAATIIGATVARLVLVAAIYVHALAHCARRGALALAAALALLVGAVEAPRFGLLAHLNSARSVLGHGGAAASETRMVGALLALACALSLAAYASAPALPHRNRRLFALGTGLCVLAWLVAACARVPKWGADEAARGLALISALGASLALLRAVSARVPY